MRLYLCLNIFLGALFAQEIKNNLSTGDLTSPKPGVLEIELLLEEDKSPIDAAKISLTNLESDVNITGKTDVLGKWSPPNILPEGEYLLDITTELFQKATRIIDINSESNKTITIYLLKKGTTVQDVVKTFKEVRVEKSKLDFLREQQKFDGTLTILDSERIAELAITDISHLTEIIPNMVQLSSIDESTGFSLRGISPMRLEPVIGYYIDGVPQDKITPGLLSDIEEIRVLKGVQSTLYGQSYLGGTIDIRTKKPKSVFSAKANIFLGDKFAQKYNMSFSAPLIKEKLFFRGAMQYEKDPGWLSNVYTGNPAAEKSIVNSRFSITYLGGNHNLLVSLNIANKKLPIFTLTHAGKSIINQDGTIDTEAIKSLETVEYSKENVEHSFHNRISINLDGRLRYGKYRWILSHMFDQRNSDVDADFSLDPFMDVSTKKREHKLSTEAKFESFGSPDSSTYHWNAGVFVAFNNISSRDSILFGTHSLEQYMDTNVEQLHRSSLNNLDTAAFGEGRINFTNGISLLTGLRGDFCLRTANLTAQDRVARPFNIANPYALKGSIEEEDQIQKIDFSNLPPSYHFGGAPRVGISYKYTDLIKTYCTFSMGFRPGGFNRISRKKETIAFEKEYSYNSEIGMRTMLFKGMWNINMVMFETEWKNVQIFTFPEARSIQLIATNGGDARSMGLEIESYFYPIQPIGIENSISLTDAYFLDGNMHFVEWLDGTKRTEPLQGKKIPLTPPITVSSAISFKVPISITRGSRSFIFSPFIRTELRYIHPMYYSERNLIASARSLLLINLKGGMLSEKFDFSFFVRNVLNHRAQAYSMELAGLPSVLSLTEPIRFGMDVTFKV